MAVLALPSGVAVADSQQFSAAGGEVALVLEQRSSDVDVRRAEEIFARSVESRQVIVKFTGESSASTRSSLQAKYNLTTVRTLRTTGSSVLSVGEGRSAAEVATSLRRERGVANAEPNRLWMAYQFPPIQRIGSRVAAPSQSSVGPDPLRGQLWGLDNTGQVVGGVQGTPDIDVNAPQAWQVTEGGSGVVVGILDTGVDLEHPDLAGQIWTNPGEIPGNGTDDDGNGYVDDVHGWDFLHGDNSVYDAVDGDQHGTHVAGTVAASLENAVGVAGVAPGVKILPLKFLGPNGGTTTGAIEAIDYATRLGVRVINASWGGAGFSVALRDSISRSEAAFIAAAGNDGSDNDVAPKYPSSYDLPNVLSVAALDNTGRLAAFSNYGKISVDVGAPGVSVVSTVPAAREAAQALQVTSTAPAYKAMVWGFGLEDVTGATSRDDALMRTLTFLGTAPGDPVLVVDDDGAALGVGDAASFYTTSLAAAGSTSVTTHVVPVGASGPDAGMMQGKTVIWQTGDAENSGSGGPNLTGADQNALTTFLDAGGKLMLAGADALYSIESSAFVASLLHTVYLGEGDARKQVTGAVGSAFAGAAYSVTGADSPGGQASPYRDTLGARDSAAVSALVLPAGDYVNAYAAYNGTSMAAPHAAGVAALAATTRLKASGGSIVNVIKTTGATLPSLTNTTATGRLVRADASLLTAPTAVTATGAGSGEVTVSWQAGVSTVDGYRIYRTIGTGEPALLGDGLVFSTSFVDRTAHGDPGGSDYRYVVRAVAGTDESTDSAAAVLFVSDTRGPAALVGVTATSDANAVRLSWPASSAPDVASYTVLRATTVGGPYTALTPAPVVTTSYSDSSGVSGRSYAYVVVAQDGSGNLSDRSNEVLGAVLPEGEFHALTPARVLDTRYGTGGFGAAIGPGQSIDVQVTGVGGVPVTGVAAVAVNVTVTQPTSHGFLTVHPAGTALPLAANLNFMPDQTVPNLVVAKVGAGGKVRVYNSSGSTHVVFDVAGWFSNASAVESGARYSPLSPARVLDTRYGTGSVLDAIGPGETVDVQVTGVGGVPASGVSAVVLNVTVTQPTAQGFLTVHPAGTSLPLAANLNFVPDLTVPNLVMAKVGVDGKVSVYNSSGSTHVVFDVAGWFSDGSSVGTGARYTPLTPARVLDTRYGSGGIADAVGPGETVEVQVTGVGGVPVTGVSAVVLNVTVTQPTAAGFLTIHPAGLPLPLAANLNFTAGRTVPNLVVAKVGVGGKVSLYNSAGYSHVVFDVAGWYSASS